jgi:heptosyltransferase II
MAAIKPDIAPDSKILVVDLAFIGDLLMTTPALTCLRKAFPNAEIDLLVSPGSAPVVELNKSISSVILSGMKKGGLESIKKEAKRISEKSYDLAISFHRGHGTLLMLKLAGIKQRIGYTNGGRGFFLSRGIGFELYKHRTWNNLRLLEKALSIEIDYQTPTVLDLDPSAVKTIDYALRDLGVSKEMVAINPNAAWVTKRWLPESFATVADMINQMGFTPVLVGGPKEVPIANLVKGAMKSEAVDFTGKTSLQELAVLLSRCKALVTNDSGPMHIGQAVGIPIVSIFGPTNPTRCGPWLGKIEPVQAEIDCIKCYRKTCWHLTCMKRASVEKVVKRLQYCLNK